MITFIEHTSSNYADRTRINAMADVTIAMARDYETYGEILTEKCCKENGKMYCKLALANSVIFQSIYDRINATYLFSPLTINIAGNGIYTLKEYGYTQKSLDDIVFQVLSSIFRNVNVPIREFVCGGQTGIDESGAKTGNKLGIQVTVLAPKTWKFRDITGKDICDETKFKKRFL